MYIYMLLKASTNIMLQIKIQETDLKSHTEKNSRNLRRLCLK